jgi:DNA invertase Pin-like site-specific DNA recombinase
MRYVRTAPATCRNIIGAWDAGCRSKSDLGRSFGVSRNTVYRILEEGGRITAVREARAVRQIDIAWLAGLFEGEGTVAINGRSLTVRIAMTHLKTMWTAQAKGAVAAGVIMTLYPFLGVRRRAQARAALAAWRTQGHRIVAGLFANAMVAYRKEGYSQADIMELKIGKSTVYRHTKNHVRRMHVTTRRAILRTAPAQSP